MEIVLDSITNILSKAEDRLEPMLLEIEECGGLDKIERLQNHESEHIYPLAIKLIEDYFNMDEEHTIAGQDQIFKPMQQNVPGGGFSFN